MNPKKAKTLYKEVASDLALDESLVKDVLDFYWSSLRKQMSNLTAVRLDVMNLGTFEIMPKTLNKCIESYKNYQKVPVPKTFVRYEAYSLIEERLKELDPEFMELLPYNYDDNSRWCA